MSIFSDVPNERMSGREERKTAFAFAVETVLKIDASVLDGLVSEVAAADTTTLLIRKLNVCFSSQGSVSGSSDVKNVHGGVTCFESCVRRCIFATLSKRWQIVSTEQ